MEEKSILIIEDNKDDEALILRAFKKNNINTNIFVTRDGSQALDWLFCEGEFLERNKKVLPELILLDLKLPKINGLEVLKKIKDNSHTKFIPTVVLTTSNEESDITESYKLNANSYIRKPVDFNEFINVVKDLSNYWLSLNQNIPVNK